MKIQIVTIISLLFLFICLKGVKLYVSAEEAPDLYSPAGDVLRLNSTSFIPTVFHQNKNITYMVQFYNTFCGHCQMFAPVYKDLASRMKNWTSVVRIAGIDCSKDENLITCSENKIEGYPTILIFPPNARVQEPTDKPLSLRSLNIDWTVDDIEESVVDYVANLSATRQEYPLVVNALTPIDATELKDIKRIYPLIEEKNEAMDDQQGLQDFMFVVESESSYLGRKLILEYYRIHHKLELRRILLTNKELLKSILQQDEFAKLEENQPVLLRINGDDNIAQVLVRGEARHVLPTSQEHERLDFIHDRFKMFFEHYYSIELREVYTDLRINSQALEKALETNNLTDKSKNNTQLDYQKLLQSEPIITKRVFAIDLLKGISYMITHEIQIKGDHTPEEYNTIRNLLTILKKYLSLEKWDTSVSKFIDELRTRLDNNRSVFDKNGVTTQELRDILKLSGAEDVRSKYSKAKWVSCMESDRQHKGYTCSLWLLFHSLTAGEYVKAAPVRSKPTLVLLTMRDYIRKFLGCTVCSSNFEKESESLAQSLNNRNSSILWLWSTHNHVNQRLNNERAEIRRSLVEVIFPGRHLCQECLITDADEIGKDGKTYEDIEWNMSNVFSYLLDIYRPDRVITPTEMAALFARNKPKHDLVEVSTHGGRRRISTAGADMNQSEKWNFHDIISTSDISLCLFLYVACIVIVAIVCVALNPKLGTWKRFKTK